MLRLATGGGYHWVNLDDPKGEMPEGDAACVAFHMRLANGMDEAIAETNARAAIKQLCETSETASDYGLGSVDWAEAIQQGNAPLFHGAGYALYRVELAMLCVQDFKGVGDEAGEPVEFNKKNLALVLQSRIPGAKPIPGYAVAGATYGDSFLRHALKAQWETRTEGKS